MKIYNFHAVSACQNHINILSNREVDVLRLISNGYSSMKIGVQLSISPETVNTHRKNMRRKLKASNTASLVRAGFECGILKLYR